MARTAKQRAALRKAQLASARKRRGTGKKKTTGNRRRKGGLSPKMRRRAILLSAAAGYVGYATTYRIAANRQQKNQRNWQKEYDDAMGDWQRRAYNYGRWRGSQARYSNAGPSKPRFVRSTRGAGMPLNPQRALPGPQLALPRGRS